MGESERWVEDARVYHPRKPKESPLWSLLNTYYESFEQHYKERFEKEYGFFRPVISEVVSDYLKCGDLKEGFARVRCPECKHEFLLAFSCRGRWFCPSCHAKKVILFGEHLREEILYPVPHRQFVFSIPIILRKYFRYNRDLLSMLCHAANLSLTTFFRTTTGLKGGVPGIVMVIHTYGDYGRWHPHIHAIVADGLFTKSGTFYVMPRDIDLTPLAELFRAQVLTMLHKAGKIDAALVQNLMKWQHTSGFSVHGGTRIARDNDEGKERLAQYIIRNPFSLEKLTYIEATGKVIYHSKMTHGKNRKNFEVYEAEEFIATITQHIPEKSFQLVRYYGWYSNRARGERYKAAGKDAFPDSTPDSKDVEVLDVSTYKPRRIPSKTWRECIKKVWEADPLECPKCGFEMKIISFISAAQKDVIRRILEHLKLWEEPVPRNKAPPEKSQPVQREIFYEPIDDGWPGYEEPAITVE